MSVFVGPPDLIENITFCHVRHFIAMLNLDPVPNFGPQQKSIFCWSHKYKNVGGKLSLVNRGLSMARTNGGNPPKI